MVIGGGWKESESGGRSTNYSESHLPFGARAGTSSGIGRVGGSQALEAFTEPKTVVVTLG